MMVEDSREAEAIAAGALFPNGRRQGRNCFTSPVAAQASVIGTARVG